MNPQSQFLEKFAVPKGLISSFIVVGRYCDLSFRSSVARKNNGYDFSNCEITRRINIRVSMVGREIVKISPTMLRDFNEKSKAS